MLKHTPLMVFLTVFAAAAMLISSCGREPQPEAGKDVMAICSQGMNAYRKGDYRGFLSSFRAAAALAPDNPGITYNLARAYALGGKKMESIRLLEKTVRLGFSFNSATSDFSREEADFASIRESEEFKAIVAKADNIEKSVHNSRIAFTIPERDLMPEGMAYDAYDGAFYVGSGYKRKIIRIDRTGRIENFIEEEQDGIWNVWGMKVDARRRLLWVNSSAWYGMKGFQKGYYGFAGVFKYDLRTRKLIKKYVLDERPKLHEFNDLAVTSQGDVFVTDDLAGVVYRIGHERDTLELFLDAGRFHYPNGIALSEDEKLLFIAHIDGISILNLDTMSGSALGHPDDVSASSVDGLYFYRGSLIGVQGSFRPPRVMRFVLNAKMDRIEGAQIIEAGNPLFTLPTTGVIVGDAFFYIANSQLNRYSDEGKIFSVDKLDEIVVLMARL